MRKINSTWKELYEGYLAIKKLQPVLRLKWKRALQVAERRLYRQKLKQWEEELAVERKRFITTAIIGILLIPLILACALLLSFAAPVFGATCFFMIVVIGWIIVQGVVYHNFKKTMPVRGAEGTKLLSIEERWWQRLKPPPIQIVKYGDEGERDLLNALERNLSNDFLALHGYMAKKNLDADIIVLGPTGLWLLESKFNSGTIYCRNGKWWQEKEYYKEGGAPAIEKNEKRPYDLQWLDEKEEIVETISRRVPQDMLWVLDTIKGGIAFTHNNIHLDIDQSCKVLHGDILFWTKTIATGRTFSNFTTGVQLQIVDALSDFTSQVTQNNDRKSAKQFAKKIYYDTEQEIINFVKANV